MNVRHGDVLHTEDGWQLATLCANRLLIAPIIVASAPFRCGDVPLLRGDVPGMTLRDGMVVRTHEVRTAPLSGFAAWRASAALMRRVQIGLAREIGLERDRQAVRDRPPYERCVRF